MEKLLQTRTIPIAVTAVDREEECPVSGDFVLAEYCPDVAVVLKCFISPRILSRQWSAGRLLLDGTAVIRILYLDEERCCLREAEFSQPLSCTVDVNGVSEDAFIHLNIRTKYANCRALSPRRLEVMGCLGVVVRAEDDRPAEIPVPLDENGLHICCEEVTLSGLGGSAEKVLTVSDVADIPNERPPAEVLLGGDCRAVVTECKLLAGKAIVKGQVLFHQLYTDEVTEGDMYPLDLSLPFSQILDLDGATEGTPYTVAVTVLSDTQRCTDGPLGERRALELSAKLLVQFQTYTEQTVTLLTDAYHTGYEGATEMAEWHSLTRLGCREETTVVTLNPALPEQPLMEIVDVWVNPLSVTGTASGGRAHLEGQLQVGMLVRDMDGMLFYEERTEPYRMECPCEGDTLEGNTAVAGWQYRANGASLELQVTVSITLHQYRQIDRQVLRQFTVERERPLSPLKETVRVYYGESGERLWDIARRCRTSPTVIAEENGIAGACLEKPMVLLVPMVDMA